MLCVVSVEGGPGTLETVRDSLRAGTPVVLVAGFGRVTDLLAFAVRRTRDALPALPLGHSKHKFATHSRYYTRTCTRNFREQMRLANFMRYVMISTQLEHLGNLLMVSASQQLLTMVQVFNGREGLVADEGND